MDTAIRRWIRDKSKEKELVPPEPGVSPQETNPPDEDALPALFSSQSIPGMDFAGALRRFGGSEEIYLDILKAFVQSTPALLETLRVPAAATLPAYAITVHGIKGGSRNIGAAPLGDRAEALEKAAKAGDFDFVKANTAAFIAMAESLLGSLSALLTRAGAERTKPKKAAPDPELMAALLEACRAFDMDGVDGAMEQLNQYDYEQDAELIAWLNEQVSLAGFKQIAARLGEAPPEAAPKPQ